MKEPDIKLFNKHDGLDSWKEQNYIPKDKPFVGRYSKGKYTINYIAAHHTHDVESNTFKLIKSTIVKQNPKLIVIEGILFEKGLNPPLGDWQSEGSYASRFGIDYIGIETSRTQIMRTIGKKFRTEDLYGFVFLQQHKHFYKNMNSSKEHFFQTFNDSIKRSLDLIFSTISFNPREWFQRRFKKVFRYGCYLEYASPIENGNLTQRISAYYNYIRDLFNINTLYKLIKKYKNIVYIMGMNHFYADLRILSKTFGDPEILYV